MKSSSKLPKGANWRPIRTAPKDGTHILLSYTGGDGETRHTGQGLWVDVPPTGHVHRMWEAGKKDQIEWTREGRWEIGYVAILEHGGALQGRSFEPRGWSPYDVTHWMPLPPPFIRRKSVRPTTQQGGGK